ncbi:ATP-dependent Clp protease adaptor ClpS [bacterium]|nr:ATP-dependent Clp protease adaptor ClpS [bacterium]
MSGSSPKIYKRPKITVSQPPLYNVVMLNDDYTTMEFVVWVLTRFFEKERGEAFEIMMSIHTTGRGVAGRYVLDIAESKVALVTEEARKRGFPLKCVVEGE